MSYYQFQIKTYMVIMHKRGREMKRVTLVRRIVALFLVLTIIPLLLSCSQIAETDNKQLNDFSQQVTSSDFSGLTALIQAEKILPQNTTRIAQCDSSGRQIQLKYVDYFIKRNNFLLYAAAILYIALFYIACRICSCRKFIIKYIHNQDGYKNRPSFY